jgi:RNA polymerase sigma factor (sigma-70 family)
LIVSYLTSEAPRREIPSGGRLAEFEVLYRCQVDGVTGFFARRSRDPQIVADLTADTFFEAMRSFGSFDPAKGSGPAWLFAIARHVYARHCTRARRERDATNRDLARRMLDGDEIEELVVRIDAERAGRGLMERLEALPELDRAAVELVDLSELTPKEAAASLGVSAGALRVRLFRARARLRKEGKTDA